MEASQSEVIHRQMTRRDRRSVRSPARSTSADTPTDDPTGGEDLSTRSEAAATQHIIPTPMYETSHETAENGPNRPITPGGRPL